MKKRTILISTVCVLAVAALAVGAFAARGRRPCRDLDAAEVVSAAVRLAPPDETIPVPDTAALCELLRDVVIYREDPSYVKYDGQGVIFMLELADGTRTQVMAYNPFLVIDGVGYRTKYEPCEALSQYANELLARQGDF